MADASCTGPECLFTGPDSAATAGNCADTAGYISQAELAQYSSGVITDDGTLARRTVTTWHDDDSDSDLMTYGDGTWVAYMTDDTKASRIDLYASYNFAGSVEWAVDLATFVEDAAEIEAVENLTALEDDFTAAFTYSNYDIDDFTTYNLSDLATRLDGFTGCDFSDTFPIHNAKKTIYSGWQQSWKIMNLLYKVANSGIDFNEAATLEYLGPSGIVSPAKQTAFNHIFKNMATIQPGWLGIRAWKLHVRCDDPENLCPCGTAGGPWAYTVNKDASSGLARINFCPRYFYEQTLDEKMVFASTALPVSTYANMNNYYQNQGAVWYHQLLHVDWASTANTDSNVDHITEIKLLVQTEKLAWKYLTAYGPKLVKVLARWGSDTGSWTQRNADSLTWYAMAKYVQNALGNVYPHLPLAHAIPQDVQPASTDILSAEGDDFTVYANGTIDPPDNTTLAAEYEWSTSLGICAKADDEDGDLDSSDVVTISSDWALQSAYPTDYLSSWSSWAGLTATTTTSPAAASATATWTLAVYSDADCSGDYYSVEGHNIDSSSDTCLVLQDSDLSTESITTGNSCRWFTDGGDTWADCSSSTLTQPKSWRVVRGVCTAFDTTDCSSDGYKDAYTPAEGCHNYDSDLDDTQMWLAVRCGAEVAVAGLMSSVSGNDSTTAATKTSSSEAVTSSVQTVVTATSSTF